MGSDNSHYTQPTKFVKLEKDANGFVQSPNGKYIAVGVGRHKISIYKADQLETPLKTFEGCTRALLSAGQITPQFSHNSEMFAYRWNEKIRIMDTETLELIKEIDNDRKWETIAFSHDDRYISIGHHKDIINVYDLTVDSSVALVGSFEACVTSCIYADKHQQIYINIPQIWHPKKNVLLAKWKKSVNFFEVNQQEVKKVHSINLTNKPNAMSFSPNGKFLSIATKEGVIIFDSSYKHTFKEIKGKCAPSAFSYKLNPQTAFSSDSQYFATANDYQCFIYKTQDMSLVHTITLNHKAYYMSFSPNGKYLGIGCSQGYFVFNRQLGTGFYTNLRIHKSCQKIDTVWQGEENLIGRWKESRIGIFNIPQLESQGVYIDDLQAQKMIERNQTVYNEEIYEAEQIPDGVMLDAQPLQQPLLQQSTKEMAKPHLEKAKQNNSQQKQQQQQQETKKAKETQGDQGSQETKGNDQITIK